MQSVTNIFIVNLAMADMLVMLFCAPPSVIWDVTSTWIFGDLMCRIVIYIQVGLIYFPKSKNILFSELRKLAKILNFKTF